MRVAGEVKGRDQPQLDAVLDCLGSAFDRGGQSHYSLTPGGYAYPGAGVVGPERGVHGQQHSPRMTESHMTFHRTSFAPARRREGGVRRTGKVDPAGIVAVLIYALRLCSITELLFVHRTNRMCAVWSAG